MIHGDNHNNDCMCIISILGIVVAIVASALGTRT